MSKKTILSIAIACLLSGSAMAQMPMMQKSAKTTEKQAKRMPQKTREARGAKQSLTPEQIKERQQKQAEGISQKLNLTPEQTKAFIPLMQEYQTKKIAQQKEIRTSLREFNAKENKSSADYQKIINTISDNKINDANLQKEYYTKLSKVIPAEKVYELNKMDSNIYKMQSDSKNAVCPICKKGKSECQCKDKGNMKNRGQK